MTAIIVSYRHALEVRVVEGSLDAFTAEISQVVLAAVFSDDGIDRLRDYPDTVVGIAVELAVISAACRVV